MDKAKLGGGNTRGSREPAVNAVEKPQGRGGASLGVAGGAGWRAGEVNSATRPQKSDCQGSS